MTRVLVIHSGDNTGLNFVRSLRLAGGYEIIGLDFAVDNFHASEADVTYLGNHEESVVSQVNRVVEKHGADLLYVADTGDALDEIAAERNNLQVRVLLPRQEHLIIAEDKWLTYVNLSRDSIPAPDTLLVRSVDDLKEVFSRREAVWLRLRKGSGGRGAIGTSNFALAHAWIESQSGWGKFTAAERLTERSATFSGLWHNGKLVASQLRERLEWKYSERSPSGVTGITGSQRTIWDASLHSISVQAVQAVAPIPHGIMGVDFAYDKQGQPHVTEVQPARFYSSIFFLASAGLNMPHIYCQLALDTYQGTQPLINPIKQTFYWLKTVDKEPRLLSEAEYLDVSNA